MGQINMRKIGWILFFLFFYLKIFAINQGTEFWVSFPRNFNGIGNKIIMITSDYNASVTITTSAGTNTYTVLADGILTITLPSYLEAIGNDSITDTGIYITSSEPITLYGLNRTTETTDGFLALPYDSLGTTYVILSAKGRIGAGQYGSQFTVLATADNTEVTIIPSVSTGSRIALQPYNINLNSRQVYQLMDTSSSQEDLSGTIITSDKPVAVFSSHRCAYIPVTYEACDYLIEQMPPADSWGLEFAVARLAGRATGDTLRIITFTDNTIVQINGVPEFVLNKYQVAEKVMTLPSYIKSNAPILVAQYANGSAFDGLMGDPSMILITPVEQFITKSRFVIPWPSYASNYVSIITTLSGVGNIKFDGNNIPSYYYSPISTSNYYYARLTISASAHTLTSDFPFSAYLYGFSNFESYGYQAGCGTIKFTPTLTPTITMTHTITETFTVTMTITPTKTKTITSTITFTKTMTVTKSITATITPTKTKTETITPTQSKTFTATIYFSETITPSITFSETFTDTPTTTMTYTITETTTQTIFYTATSALTITFTITLTMTNTVAFTITRTITLTFTITESYTVSQTMTPTISFTTTTSITETVITTATVTPALYFFDFEIIGVFPNPFKDKTEIIFYVSKETKVHIKIFTVSGEIVREEYVYSKAGYNSFLWDGLNFNQKIVASGVFICKIIVANDAGEKLYKFTKLICVR